MGATETVVSLPQVFGINSWEVNFRFKKKDVHYK